MVQQLRRINKDHEESTELNVFFGTLKKYNEGKEVNGKLITSMEQYFKYRWKKDKFLFLTTPLDVQLLG